MSDMTIVTSVNNHELNLSCLLCLTFTFLVVMSSSCFHLYFAVVCLVIFQEVFCLSEHEITSSSKDEVLINSLSDDVPRKAVKREISLLPPSSPQAIDVKFRILYSPLETNSRSSRDNHTIFTYNASMDDLKNLPLDPNKKSIYLMHGWLDTIDSSRFWWNSIVESVRQNNPEDYQVIFVDWSRGSSSTYYLPAVSNMRVTADMIASNIRTFIDDLGFDPMNIRLIGFSLGAHLAGFTGKLLTGRRKLAWITGLEPANAMFEMSSPAGSLFQTDAHYVDIVHSASGNILQGFSKIQPLGHRDYYINGAYFPQPGCDNEMPFGAIGAFFSTRRPCSHDRAPLAFSTSRDSESCSSMAFECASYEDFLNGLCSRTCNPEITDIDDSGCVWFGFTNDILHRSNWPPTPPANRNFQTLFVQSNGILPCLSHYKIDIKTGKTDNPSSGTFFLTDNSGQLEEVRMTRDFASFRSNVLLISVKRSLENVRELSLNWQSSRNFLGSLLPVLPFLGHHLPNSRYDEINVQRVTFESMNPPSTALEPLANASLNYNFCGLHSRQEIKSGSRLILVKC